MTSFGSAVSTVWKPVENVQFLIWNDADI